MREGTSYLSNYLCLNCGYGNLYEDSPFCDWEGYLTCKDCGKHNYIKELQELKSPQRKGRDYEKIVEEGEVLIPLSGAGVLKEDSKTDEYLIQKKHTTKSSYSIKLEDLQKLKRNAMMVQRTAKFRIAFEVNGKLEEWDLVEKKTLDRLSSD